MIKPFASLTVGTTIQLMVIMLFSLQKLITVQQLLFGSWVMETMLSQV